MAGPYVADRVKQTTTTAGTGTLNLDATIPTGARSFVTGVGSGNTCYFCIEHTTADEWEVCFGTITTGTPATLSRTTVLSSSTGAAVSFSSGVKNVFVVGPAKYAFPFLKVPITDAVYVQDETYFGGTVGLARGNGANDFQRYRQNSDQIAAGNYSALVGGTRNKSSGNCSFLGAGNQNSCTGDRAVVGGGESNSGTAKKTFVGGGQGNQASQAYNVCTGGYNNNCGGGSYSTLVGGASNSIGAGGSFIGGGEHNSVNGVNSVVAGGVFNFTYAYGCAILGGLRAVADKYCQQSQAAGIFNINGDAQTSSLVMRKATNDATTVEMFLDNNSARLTMNNFTAWLFDILIVAHRTNADDESAAYRLLGCIDKNSGAGTVALVGTVTKTVIAEDNAGWDVDATADTANSSLKITVTGEAAKNIQWVAFVRLVETSR